MLLSAVSVLVVAQSISEIPEGLMNNPVLSSFGEVCEELMHHLWSTTVCRGIPYRATKGEVKNKYKRFH